MNKSNILENEDIPQVAMDAMNDVHRDELAIVNNINAAIIESNLSQITLLCHQWLEHTQAHFEKENSMMEKYGFPAYHCHHGEHVLALQGLQAVVQQWGEDENIKLLAVYVRETWPQWYITHISSMDMVTSAFIKQSIQKEQG